MGTKFTTKFLYVQSGDGVKKPILQFKKDQGDTCKYKRYNYRIQYDRQISIYFSTGKVFDYLYLLYFQSICGLLNSVG